ncbi:MAG TPA: CHAT domain-containing protein [Thermoanaerobaculia bacterium]|nr:CHAT domain-containing protein [Thermoanaerobaculia bacterium]
MTKIQQAIRLAIPKSERPLHAWMMTATLLLVVLMVSSVLLNIHWLTDPLEILQGDHRVLQARLTGFKCLPLVHRKRSAVTQSLRKKAAITELLERVTTARTTENLHRLALGELALGRCAEAHDLLVEALVLDPANAALLSDLAAAQIGMSKIADAAETSARALDSDPDLPTARFNWALALELLSVRPSAVIAWDEYVRVDPASQWSHEAVERRAHLELTPVPWKEDKSRLLNGVDAAVVKAIVARHPQQIRQWVQREVIPEWVRSGSPHLALARSVSSCYLAITGDRYLLDVIDHAERSANPAVREGILLYGVGSVELANRQMEAAGAKYAEAEELLRRVGSPLALSADVVAALTDFYEGRSDNALTRLDRVKVALRAGRDRYLSISADEAWVRGLVLSRRDPNASLESYRDGVADARASRDTETEAGLTALIAEILDRIGDPSEADRNRADALRQLETAGASPDRLYVAFSSNAYAALRARRPHLALAFIDAQQTLANDDPLLLAESDVERALALRDLGRLQDAAQYVRFARKRVSAISTQGLRDRTASNIAFIAGTIEARSNPRAAVSSLTYAIDTWRQYGWRVHTATAYLLRGEALLISGSRSAAENDFRAGITEMEQQREGLSEPRLREAYFERADRLFERLIEFLIDESKFDDALTVAERKRSRDLLDAIAADMPNHSAPPVTAAGLNSAVGPATAVLEFMVLDRGPAIWIVHGGHTSFIRGDLSRHSLERTIRDYLNAIASDDAAAIDQHGRVLYDELIAPAIPYLSGADNIVLIADGALHGVPFAALVGPDSRYLIENFRLLSVPSASTFVHESRVAPRGGNLLAVAEPRPFGMDFLSNAEVEARQIADLYPGERALIGEEIGPDQFLARSGRAAVVHFAGHASVSDGQPAASALIFESPQNRAPIPLRASTIAGAHLPSRPFVVLAGCSTGRGPLRRNEGVDSLAAAFLRAGARGILATLWDIDDSPSARLLRIFHGHLRRGARATDALRQAQLSLLESNDPDDRRPKAWAGFVLIGGV